MRAGPILTVVAERSFDRVYLFSTPKAAEISEQTAAAITERHHGVTVEIMEVPLKDPTNYLGILRQLRSHFKTINASHPDAEYSISVSSGTPHMHACWLLLAASGEIPATILQSTPPEFVPEGRPLVREIDIHQKDFPTITRPLDGPEFAEDDDSSIITACRELGIVGEDPAFRRALHEAFVYSQYDDFHVLLLGETGSGKEHFAQFIHHLGPRAGRPMVTVNCSSIPENLVESQLFGHKKGSFTGASSDHEGKFKSADRGVLFLDEVGELPLAAQAKLLRVLDQGEIEPVGSTKPVKVNVRVIAATHRNLREMVQAGTFREDLYQRFGSSIAIPPLRSRKVDIPLLASHLLGAWNARHEHQKRLAPAAINELIRYPWPGNVRELRRVIQQSAMLASSKIIQPSDLRFEAPLRTDPMSALPDPSDGFKVNEFLDEIKLHLIQRALELGGGVQARAAKLLGITPQAINQFLKGRNLQ
ncbi:MAG: RNA repair transcriptional activator RtcR family protein [Akkermansiaceae bacterium]|nr:RNA repair transcriptional activator RtcR family protein [Akkermansiaceae bacterium]